MAKKDYYEVFGVDRGVSDGDLKKAYRRIAMKLHPDRNPDDAAAEEQFKEANEAYEVLSDPEKRQVYDQFGHEGLDPNSGAGRGAGGFGDIFGDVFGDIFGGAFGQIVDPMFGQIFGQVFGQIFWGQKTECAYSSTGTEQHSVQYYPDTENKLFTFHYSTSQK